ncbi:hypothetical protein BsWGS_24303 [Bradybaena similaris]
MDSVRPLVFISCCFLCLNMVAAQIEHSEDWNSEKFKEEAAQTFNLIFHKYNNRMRPPQAYIEIVITVTLQHIRYLDVQKQELQTVLDVEMTWTDTRLHWYPVKVFQISANTSTVWTPDIVYTNSVAETKVLYPTSVRITNRGFVTWTKKEVVTTQCDTHLNPLTQTCTIDVGFMSNTRNVQTDRFISDWSSFNLADDFKNHEWSVENATMEYINDITTNKTNSVVFILVLEPLKKETGTISISEPQTGDDSDEIKSNGCSQAAELTNGNKNEAKSVRLNLTFFGLVLLECCIVCDFLLYR